jgi:hypothetical protein
LQGNYQYLQMNRIDWGYIFISIAFFLKKL